MELERPIPIEFFNVRQAQDTAKAMLPELGCPLFEEGRHLGGQQILPPIPWPALPWRIVAQGSLNDADNAINYPSDGAQLRA